MAKAKCTNDEDCQLAARAVGHYKTCPLKVAVETLREKNLLSLPLADLLTPAEKERVPNVDELTVTYDTSPLLEQQAELARDVFTNAAPDGFADAPQWQKNAWDSRPCICPEPPSDGARIAGMSFGGPSEEIRSACPRCFAGADCPPECKSRKPDSMTLPVLSVKRGGIKFPRYRVELTVQPARKRFMRRQTWHVHMRYWDPAQHKHMHHTMEGFPAENLARNAAAFIKFMVQAFNKQYAEERG